MNAKTVRWTLLFSAAAALGVAGCKPHENALKQAMKRPPASVSVTPAKAQNVPLYLDEIGHTIAVDSVMVQPQVTGKITEVHFKDGEMVKKGQLLFTIDARPFTAVLDQAKAALKQDQANVSLADSELRRSQSLKGTGAISETDLETKQNALNVAQAQVEAAKAAIEKAQLDVEYCEIRSPIDGRAGHRLVDPGNVVSASGQNGGTNLLSIQKFAPIYADFTVTEQDLQDVRGYMKEHPLQVQVWVPSATDKIGTGEMTFLDNSVQSSSGTVMLRATLPNENDQFWPGQYVNVRLILTTLKDAVMVPNDATQIGQDGSYVFVVNDQSVAEQRPVELGQREGSDVVVTKGVKAGEQVITSGQMMVIPGAPVHVTAPAATQAVAEGANPQ
jgi:multidrug efflux system membrane fusion protein